MPSKKKISLVIKAPNQIIPDQTVECDTDWRVEDLKSYLSLVYPNNPPVENQKLIYSGQLLPDSSLLSDVIKSYEGQIYNTLHLVCSQLHSHNVQQSTPQTSQNQPWNNRDEATHTISPSLNVRYRFSNPFLQPTEPLQFNMYNQQQFYQQMFWMQNAYMQYLAQYFPNSPIHHNLPRVGLPEGQSIDRSQNPNQPVQNRNEEEIEDDGHMNRDWLDWVNIAIRLAILFGIVYFHSSPVRCIMVTTMALLLYHLGMLRWRPNQDNNNINHLNNNNRVVADNPRQEQPTEESQAPPQINTIQFPNWLTLCWTFVTSFFLSLIPDQREV